MRHFAMNYRTQRKVVGLLFVAPVVLGTLVFDIAPIIVSFVAGFTQWDGINQPQFVGLDNYIRLFTGDRLFKVSLVNTMTYSLATIPLSILVGLFLAILVNDRWLSGLFKTMYFAPHITSTIAIGVVWSWILAPGYGLLNNILARVGIDGPAWLFSRTWAMPAVVMVSIWRTAGYNMVLYLAGLRGISQQYYEAAKIDGANSWHLFRYVTWPMLTPTTLFLTIMSFITSFQVFDLVYIMTEGGPGTATTVYIYYLYQNAFHFFRMGLASAMAWILFAVIAAITLLQWRAADRWVFYS